MTITVGRMLHVLGVVWWVGGVVMVTATILPALGATGLSEAERLNTFKEIRRRFAWQARAAVLLVGASGLYMLVYLGGAARLALPSGWWIDLMIVTWTIFALILFVVEPLGVLHKTGLQSRPRAFLMMHVFLSFISLVTVAVSILGAHGALY